MAKIEETELAPGAPSTVAIRHHPIHPAVVDFPIAFLITAPVTDFLFWQSGLSQWAEFSFWLIAVGCLAGFVAVITGLIDFLTIAQARQHAAGWFHFLLTDLAVFLTTFNLIARLDDRRGAILFSGLGLSVAVALLLVIAGFLGGRLVFGHRIGVYGPPKTPSGEA